MPARDFWEMLIFASEIEPVGGARADLQAGTIAATVANAVAGAVASLAGRTAQHWKAQKPSDFMPDYEENIQKRAKKKRKPSDLLQVAKIINRAYRKARPHGNK